MSSAALARALGAEPRVIPLLVKAIAADAEGRWKDREQQPGRAKIEFAPGVVQIALLLIASLASVALALGIVANGITTATVGVLVTVFSGLAAFVTAWMHGIDLILADEDVPVVGHWPVTARDVGVARLWILFRRTIQVTLAMSIVPSLVLTFMATPYVVAGLVTFVATLLQAFLVTSVFAALLFALRRTLGRKRAQQLSNFVVIFAIITGGQAPRLLRDRLPEAPPPWLLDHAIYVGLVPPFTFVGWPALFEMPWAVGLGFAVAGLVILFLCFRFTVNLIARRGVGEQREARRATRRASSSWIEGWLFPWLPGVGARVVRKLVVAHLRDDRHFLWRVFMIPLQTTIVSAAWVIENGPLALVAEAEGARPFHLVLVVVAILGFATTVAATTSGLRDARWVVTTSAACAANWAGWQRGLTRAINLGVLLPLVVGLHVAAGSPMMLVVEDLALLLLLHESGMGLAQWIQWRAPFTMPPKGMEGSIVAASILLGLFAVPALAAWLILVHDSHLWAKALTVVGALAVVLLARQRTARRELNFV